nr:hypothetical protein [Aneurinibacillus terranovensis]
MFSLSHGYKDALPKWILGLFHGGIAAAITAMISGILFLELAGILLIAAGMLLFALLSFLLLPFSFIWGDGSRLVLPVLYLYLYGWISLSLLGYLYKIVPFLWWTQKYSQEMGKTNVPLLKDLTNERIGRWLFCLMIIRMARYSFSLLVKKPGHGGCMSGSCFLAAALFTFEIFNVFRK